MMRLFFFPLGTLLYHRSQFHTPFQGSLKNLLISVVSPVQASEDKKQKQCTHITNKELIGITRTRNMCRYEISENFNFDKTASNRLIFSTIKSRRKYVSQTNQCTTNLHTRTHPLPSPKYTLIYLVPR